MRILGKVIRSENCPIGKNEPCNKCPHYHGWALDMFTNRIYIWCQPKNIIDVEKMKMVVPTT